ncbi:ferric siderophore transport system periplasmic binding protein [Alcanivorax jadensis T9]|jgi:protein TonB|uniref:Protein TonB n=1 Tax=Alcanivorax jadensis T9 TaxID=1177181 RepID=A0ABR4W919_9GAMM|nr:energy transducer TonB [Alcanivorax jadensis]KGD59900.1 ferric siderophore transport system periplasmic binding protein [Alcanivorax jadensis T9]MBP23369.1 energy transducer TonB [Alcanivorax sp.]
MTSRTLFAWVASALIHASVLVTVGALTLAGGRPSKPGVTEMVVNLSAPPAEKPAAPPAPAKPEPAPKPEPKPKPKVKPKPKPVAKPKPEPKPEPEPEPVVAKSDVVEEQDTQEDAESEQAAASQTQQVGAKGMAGDPGEGVHQSGDDESDLLKYKAKVRNTIVYNKQYPHRARMRRQQGTVNVSFWVNASGRAENVTLEESSGSRILDRATKELISRLRFDKPPSSLAPPIRFTLPVDYNLGST